jgi:hypothetical protein
MKTNLTEYYHVKLKLVIMMKFEGKISLEQRLLVRLPLVLNILEGMKGVKMYALAGGALSGLGSLAGAWMQTEAANKANKQQMDLAKNSIQYRVADAERAGIHPLYALGAPTLSTSHVTSSMGQGVADAAGHLGKAITNMGQAKANNLAVQQQAAQLNSMDMDNTMKRMDLEKKVLEHKKWLDNFNNPATSNVQNPLSALNGFDHQELEEKVGNVWSEIYSMVRVPYSYVKNAIKKDPLWWINATPKAVANAIRLLDKDYDQTELRNPKRKWKGN